VPRGRDIAGGDTEDNTGIGNEIFWGIPEMAGGDDQQDWEHSDERQSMGEMPEYLPRILPAVAIAPPIHESSALEGVSSSPESVGFIKAKMFLPLVFEQYFEPGTPRRSDRIKDEGPRGENLQDFVLAAMALPGHHRNRLVLHGNSKFIDLGLYRTCRKLDAYVDIDSVIHISILLLTIGSSFPEWFNDSLTYFAFPNRARGLQKTIHISVSLDNRPVKVSNLPNFEIGTFGPRGENRIVICFPHMRRKKGGIWVNTVDTRSLEDFYDNYSRRALLDCARQTDNPVFEATIPFSYAVCEAKSRVNNGGGKFSFSGLSVPATSSRLYFSFLQSRTRGSPFDKHLFVIYTKGLKFAVAPENAMEQLAAMPGMNFWLELGRRHPMQTYFDVACSYFDCSRKEAPACVFLTKEAFGERKNSGHHQTGEEDITALLDDLRGFRCETKERSRSLAHIFYAQLYSSEKAGVVGSMRQALASSFSVSDVMASSGKFCQASKIVGLCWPQMAQSSYSLRFEIRTSYTALLYLIGSKFRPLVNYIGPEDCIVIPSSHLSLYKLLLAQCYGSVINTVKSRNPFGIETGSGGYRSVALMTTLLKGLISRLDDSSWNRELYSMLDIDGLLKTHGRVVIPEGDFDHFSGSLLLAEKELKVVWLDCRLIVWSKPSG